MNAPGWELLTGPARYWAEHIESGAFDGGLKDLRDVKPDPSVTVQLTQADLAIIEESLKRRFLSVKRSRVDVIHAVIAIRNARDDYR